GRRAGAVERHRNWREDEVDRPAPGALYAARGDGRRRPGMVGGDDIRGHAGRGMSSDVFCGIWGRRAFIPRCGTVSPTLWDGLLTVSPGRPRFGTVNVVARSTLG